MEASVLKQWYGKPTWLWVFLPWVPLFWLARLVRRWLLTKQAPRLPVPVVIIGNITVGGTGKTPLIMALANALMARTLRVGVVTLGYGGNFNGTYLRVDNSTDPTLCGDEPALLAQTLSCPICVGRDRVAAAQELVRAGCQVILSDDGLQHYRLARDLELIVLDASRGLGNGWCLPIGPLREGAGRLKEADWALVNGGSGANSFSLAPRRWRDLATNQAFAFQPWPWGEQTQVCALAGIGNPERFFRSLEDWGLTVTRRALPDHHRFNPMDFAFAEGQPLLITAKDAVKCRMLAPPNTWVLDVEAQLPAAFVEDFCTRVQTLCRSPQEHRP
ncbi:MAG TPA: tetraacyldisaccharide 4'-kinase [Cellvibrionaceae bacterium]|nr:tetraacyldisaccharide 4'-kinase [Cellvibrionaceae bacterium]